MKRGFTLIELLVVIAIIAILAAILFPVFAKAREKSRQAKCTSNQRQIVTAMLMWAQDHDETLPPADTVWGEIGLEKGVLVCPTKAAMPNGYVMPEIWGDKALGDLPSLDLVILSADGKTVTPGSPANTMTYDTDYDMRHSKGLIVGCADGHVQNLNSVDGPVLPYAWPTGAGWSYDWTKAGIANGFSYPANTYFITSQSLGNRWNGTTGYDASMRTSGTVVYTKADPAFNNRSSVTLSNGGLVYSTTLGPNKDRKGFTAVLVCKTTSPNCVVMHNAASNTNVRNLLTLTNGKPGTTFGTGYVSTTSKNFADGLPHVFVVSVGAGYSPTITIYADGEKMTSGGPIDWTNSTDFFWIGRDQPNTPASWMNGSIAEIRVVGPMSENGIMSAMTVLRYKYNINW